MKKILLILLCLPMIGVGQDNIILKSGEEILSKVIELDNEKIKYKRYSNLNGPIYNIYKAEVLMIKYENGEKEIIKLEEDNLYQFRLYKKGEKKYGNAGLQFSPYFLLDNVGYPSFRFELDMFAKRNHYSSAFFGFLISEDINEISFGAKLYGNNETPATFVLTPSIHHGKANMLITYSDTYGTFNRIESHSYTTINFLIGPYLQFRKKINLTLQIGMSFYLPNKNLEWDKPSKFMFKPSIGMRF